MPADSSLRKLLKRALAPFLGEGTYRLIQAAAKAWDIRNGSWSEAELDLVRCGVRPGESAIDIGANYGLYCYHLSRAVGPSGTVYAFEPVPFTAATCQLIGKLLRFHRNVTVFPRGCGDRAGRLAFTVPVQHSGAIAAGQTHAAARNDERPGKEFHAPHPQSKEIWCEVVVLDEALADVERLSLVKCDIEGADLFALRGAQRLLAQHHPTVLCEISAWFLEGFGLKPEAFDEFFAGLGYRMYHYDVSDGKGRLTPTSVAGLGTFATHNYVFIHPDRQDRFAHLLPGSVNNVEDLEGVRAARANG